MQIRNGQIIFAQIKFCEAAAAGQIKQITQERSFALPVARIHQ